MDFIERLQALSKKVGQLADSIETEEATKTALVMPFLHNVLGYDIFDPSEVIPEFTADTGTKKGEKVDYALMKDGEVQILIECKKVNETLSPKHSSQLYRYFSVTNARIAILTNGCEYQFFTDLDAPNKMDNKPFTEITKKALKQFLNDSINARLKYAIGSEERESVSAESKGEQGDVNLVDEDDSNPKIVTTEEELDGYNVVKAILREKVEVSRVAHRDTQSYFGILLDDNNRKPLCRLHFNGRQKYIGLFDANKKETKNPIDSVDDIFQYAGQLKASIDLYE
ncbi:type I restriction endonuclease [Salinivibrio proteolyticus]|uniref:type I restriction endonuclease n=1 Tax=Salinivibrio proteolyticus TaxID=334715 RepID=UPI0009899838|nr:type I restriction endonuclease [Salinivibrio proteolyticus]OOF29807.1 hypothetical protein BZJ20_13740 [Salinivibrio proteolyticus]